VVTVGRRLPPNRRRRCAWSKATASPASLRGTAWPASRVGLRGRRCVITALRPYSRQAAKPARFGRPRGSLGFSQVTTRNSERAEERRPARRDAARPRPKTRARSHSRASRAGRRTAVLRAAPAQPARRWPRWRALLLACAPTRGRPPSATCLYLHEGRCRLPGLSGEACGAAGHRLHICWTHHHRLPLCFA